MSPVSVRYSVIIPSYNRAHQLPLTLSSFAAQTYDKKRFEVIVVDDGSTDNTKEVVRNFRAPFKLRYTANKTRQSAAVTRNRGASLAKGKYIIFNDADFLVYRNFLNVISKKHRRNRNAIISPFPYSFRGVFTHYYPDFDTQQRKSFRAALRHARLRYSTFKKSDSIVPIITCDDVLHNSRKLSKLRNWSHEWAMQRHIKKTAQQTDVAPFFSFITRCIALRKRDFDAVGGFCEEFKNWGLEDQELGYRLHKHGVPYICLRTRVGLHQEHPSSSRARDDTERNLAVWLRRAGYNDLELTLQFRIHPWDSEYKKTLRSVARHRGESKLHRQKRHDLRRECRKLAKSRIKSITKPEDTGKLRIYFYSECLSGQGGMETVLSSVAKGLMSRGHDVKIILDAPSDDLFWESNLPIIHLAPRRGYGNELRLFRASINRIPCPDVIIALDAQQTAVARKAVKQFSPRPVVLSWVHFSPHIRTRDNGQWTAQISSADAHIAICRGLEEQLRELTPSIPIHQIYNPVATPVSEIPLPDTRPIFLYVGRLFNHQKRIDRILTALSQVHGDWTLKIIGDGQDANSLRNLASELRIDNRIDWLGWKRDPWNTVDSATCLVLSSDYEGFGMVAVESLARGVPVILADCPTGPKEIVQSGINGWLFPPNNTEALRDILDDIVWRRISLPSPVACKRSVEKFNENNILHQFETMVRQHCRH